MSYDPNSLRGRTGTPPAGWTPAGPTPVQPAGPYPGPGYGAQVPGPGAGPPGQPAGGSPPQLPAYAAGPPLEPRTDPMIGSMLADRYRILRKLGEGGMGVVYLAEHVFIERRVALKVLSEDFAHKPDLVARFMQEAKAASKIGQENIIDITDFGQTPSGSVFFAMEFLEGMDLAGLIKKGPVPWGRAQPILLQICRALSAAHQKGIIHRDMKPENVFLIEREGRSDFVKVLDFGIAKVSSLDDGGPKLTRTGMIFGTPEYMSPEQAQGIKPDHRVDIYAVGCIAYEMVTGQVPFTSETFMGILAQHMFEPPRPPTQLRPDLEISPAIEAVVLRALEKDRERRFATMFEMQEAFTRLDPVAVAAGGAGLPAGPGSPTVAVMPPQQASGLRPMPMPGSGLHQMPAPGTPPAGTFRSTPPPGYMSGRLPQALAGPMPRPGGRKQMIIVGAIAAVLAGTATAYFMLSDGPPSGTGGPGPQADAGFSGTRDLLPDGGVVAVPPVTPKARRIVVTTDPADAEVYHGERKLGPSGTPLELPASTSAATLHLRRGGYREATVEVVAGRDVYGPVKLDKLAETIAGEGLEPGKRPTKTKLSKRQTKTGEAGTTPTAPTQPSTPSELMRPPELKGFGP